MSRLVNGDRRFTGELMADQREAFDVDHLDEDQVEGLDVSQQMSNQYLGTADELLARYTHCSFCGANLHFSHITDFSRNMTQELSRCPECGIKAEPTLHRLQ